MNPDHLLFIIVTALVIIFFMGATYGFVAAAQSTVEEIKSYVRSPMLIVFHGMLTVIFLIVDIVIVSVAAFIYSNVIMPF